MELSTDTAMDSLEETSVPALEALPLPEAAEPSLKRPAWLEAAERHYNEGLKALEQGNEALAGKNFRKTLKLLSQKSDGRAVLDFKDEIEALLGKAEENLMPAPSEEGPTAGGGLEVSEQELQNAPREEAPAAAGRTSYQIPMEPDNPLVQKYIALYTTGPRRKNMQRALERLGLYRDIMLKQLKETGMPRELLYLPLVESEYTNTAVSRAGAVGLWQFMSGTGRRYGLKINYWLDERRDPEKATRAALAYLKSLRDWFDDWHLALAAYNRGEFGVQRDMEYTRSPDYGLLSQRNGLPRETEHYVPKFMACVLIADNAASYGFDIAELSPPAVDEVVLEKPLDLRVAAECAGATEKTLQELNPTLRLWCTPKNEPRFVLKIPAGTRETFLAALAQVKDWTPSSGFVKYKVKRGDFLGKIATRFKTSVKAIQKDNQIRDPRRLKPGQVLVIRPGKKYKED